MKELSLSERLMRYFRKHPNDFISSGEIQRLVMQYTNQMPRTAVRRLQELTEEGKLERKIMKKHTWYRIANSAPITLQEATKIG